MLRQVQSDRNTLAHGWLPFAADSIRQQFGTQMPQGGHPPHHSITSSARASSVGLPPLALSGALLVRRDHGDASMHRVHDLAPRLSIKPIGELVQSLVQSRYA